jgi:hypothetical protein
VTAAGIIVVLFLIHVVVKSSMSSSNDFKLLSFMAAIILGCTVDSILCSLLFAGTAAVLVASMNTGTVD